MIKPESKKKKKKLMVRQRKGCRGGQEEFGRELPEKDGVLSPKGGDSEAAERVGRVSGVGANNLSSL